jgi:hypothetical protein
VANATHYVVVNLSALQGAYAAETALELLVRGQVGDLLVAWSAWSAVPLPWTYIAPGGGLDAANLWGCWYDEALEPYCHALASKFAAPVRVTGDGSAVTVEYAGAWLVTTELVVACGDAAGLDLADATAAYMWGSGNTTFSFVLESAVACPRPWEARAVPKERRAPPPAGPSVEPAFARARVAVDLRELAGANGARVALGANGSFEDAAVWFAPWAQAACPAGRDCGVHANDTANIWKCTPAGCYPIGDARYGVAMRAIDGGVEAAYAGGAGGYQARVLLLCGEGAGEFEDVAYEDEDGAVALNYVTHDACQRPIATEAATTAGSAGARVIGIVGIVGGTVVVVVGVAAYCVRRRLRKKDSESWTAERVKLTEVESGGGQEP